MIIHDVQIGEFISTELFHQYIRPHKNKKFFSRLSQFVFEQYSIGDILENALKTVLIYVFLSICYSYYR